MNVTASKEGSTWKIIVDGQRHTLKTMGEYLGVSSCAVREAAISSRKPFDVWCVERLFKTKHNLPASTKLFLRDGRYCWTTIIKKESGCSNARALELLEKWERKEIDCDELFEPPDRAKNLKKFHQEKFRDGGYEGWDLGKMQPRRETWELPCAGSCERDMETADNGMLIERGNTGSSSGGGYYTR